MLKENLAKEYLINQHGSAVKMKLSGMVRLFDFSTTTRSLKKNPYIGDDDANTFQAIKEANPYGSDVNVSKMECVDHIQNRIRILLRKIQTKQNKMQ